MLLLKMLLLIIIIVLSLFRLDISYIPELFELCNMGLYSEGLNLDDFTFTLNYMNGGAGNLPVEIRSPPDSPSRIARDISRVDSIEGAILYYNGEVLLQNISNIHITDIEKITIILDEALKVLPEDLRTIFRPAIKEILIGILIEIHPNFDDLLDYTSVLESVHDVLSDIYSLQNPNGLRPVEDKAILESLVYLYELFK